MNLNAGIIESGGINYQIVDIRPLSKIGLFFEPGNKISIGVDTASLEVIDVQIPDGYGIAIISKNKDFMMEFYGAKLSKDIYEYYFDGKRHRKDKPAIESGEFYTYYRHGLIHRLDGPTHLTSHGWSYNINGKELPSGLPRFFDGKLVGKLTKGKVIEAMQFDREYGLFLRDKLREG